MAWLSQLPDLTPIENIWHPLNLAIDKCVVSIHSYQRLKEFICEEWKKKFLTRCCQLY